MKLANHKLNSRGQREKLRALAVSALAQTACLVEMIAQQGKCNRQDFEYCLDALLDDDFVGSRYFPLGSAKAKRLLHGRDITHAQQVLSLTSSLIHVEKKLSKQPEILAKIAQGMTRIHQQAEYFNDPYHPNVIAAIAHLYGETVSTIEPRIIVKGKSDVLRKTENTEQIRCLLFAGIRAACVWRQQGGNTLHLLFGRKKLIRQIELLGHKSS
jgi:high frequency lysogenization protein